jgi:hypothetical protein
VESAEYPEVAMCTGFNFTELKFWRHHQPENSVGDVITGKRQSVMTGRGIHFFKCIVTNARLHG